MTRLRKQLVIVDQTTISPHQVTEEVSVFRPNGTPQPNLITDSFLIAFNDVEIAAPANNHIIWNADDVGVVVGSDLAINETGDLEVLSDGLYSVSVDLRLLTGTDASAGGDVAVVIGSGSGTDIPDNDYLWWSNNVASMSIPPTTVARGIADSLHWPLMKLLEGNILDFDVQAVANGISFGEDAAFQARTSSLMVRRLG